MILRVSKYAVLPTIKVEKVESDAFQDIPIKNFFFYSRE